ncbi:MAG: hypothetical protein ACKOA7_05245 [Bacteroidota bacterium]
MERKFTNDLLVSVLFLDKADPRRNRAEHIIAGDRFCTDECLALQSLFKEMAEHPLQPNQQQVDRILGALYA